MNIAHKSTVPGSPYSAPAWGDGARIQWYGERGIVNALASFITAQDDFVEAVRKLLRAVVWADGGRRDWIEGVHDARFVVEIGLADFGNPDLIIVCRVQDESLPRVIFVEAKAKPYPFSAGSNSSGMTAGYNSTINGQLSLKYRFACALANPLSSGASITEPGELFNQYQARIRDYARGPRPLLKGTVLETFAGLELIGLPEEQCSYVAFTWDDSPGRIFGVAPDHLPLFLSESGADRFTAMKPRFGWLGYQGFEGALGLGTEYRNACHGMITGPVPTPEDYRIAQTPNQLPAEEAQFIEQVLDLVRESCSGRRCIVQSHDRSLTLLCDGIRVLKVIPEGRIFVGVKVDGDDAANLQRLPVHRSIQRNVFCGFTFDPSNVDLSTDESLKTLLEVVSELYGSQRPTS